MIHRSFASAVFVWLRSFRFDGFVLAFRVLVHANNKPLYYIAKEVMNKLIRVVFHRVSTCIDNAKHERCRNCTIFEL